MRIITGIAKGKKLCSFRGSDIRPTSDKVKGSLFNMLGSSIHGSVFLDLFCGIGSIGIEAFSRGAEKVTLVDNAIKAKRLVYKNIDVCGFTNYCNHCLFYYHMDVSIALDIFEKKKEKFHFIFLDPPYKKQRVYNAILKKLSEGDILYKNGKVIVEHYVRNDLDDFYGNLLLERKNVMGDTTISFYQKVLRSEKN